MIKLFKNMIWGKKSVSDSDPLSYFEKKKKTEEDFVKEFISLGGNFVLCETIDELNNSIKNICNQKNWKTFYIYEERLGHWLNRLKINFTTKCNPTIPKFINCEHLIVENSTILFTNKQLGEHKIHELGDELIVIAKSSQFISNVDAAMVTINQNNRPIPTNIHVLNLLNHKREVFLILTDIVDD